MAEIDDGEKYITEEQPWWANDYLIFLLTIANIAIIVYENISVKEQYSILLKIKI